MEKRKVHRRFEDKKKHKKILVLGFPFIKDNKRVHNDIQTILFEKGLEATANVEHNVELIEFIKHGVVLAPGVVINGKLKSAGRIPKREEMIKWLDALEETIEEAEEMLEDMNDEEYVKELEEIENIDII